MTASQPHGGAVIWDLGNVLIPWDPRQMYRRHFNDDAKMEWFLANICTMAWNERFDAGLPFATGIAELAGRHPGHDKMIRLFGSHWPEMLGEANQANVQVLRQLKEQGVPIYALTNWSAETFPVAQQRYEFLQWFDGIVVSGTEKLIKPDPAIFRLLLNRYHLEAQRCYFIDDSLRNIEAARAMGINAIHFTPATVLNINMFNILADRAGLG